MKTKTHIKKFIEILLFRIPLALLTIWTIATVMGQNLKVTKGLTTIFLWLSLYILYTAIKPLTDIIKQESKQLDQKQQKTTITEGK